MLTKEERSFLIEERINVLQQIDKRILVLLEQLSPLYQPVKNSSEQDKEFVLRLIDLSLQANEQISQLLREIRISNSPRNNREEPRT